MLLNSIILDKFDKVKTVIQSLPEMERKMVINSKDKWKRTPIFYALYKNNYEIVDFLF